MCRFVKTDQRSAGEALTSVAWRLLILGCLFLSGVPAESAAIPAFPGAEGFGATALNNCDRNDIKVIKVTNLNDSGAGSLRDAVDNQLRDGKLDIITFTTGGYITLNSTITIKNSCVYVAGQSAPGDGITIRVADGSTKGQAFHVEGTNDVVLRYFRIRRGPGAEDSCCGGSSQFLKSTRVIADHLTLSFSTDQVFSIWGAKESTIQWSYTVWPLDDSTHSNGKHGFTMLLGNSGQANATVHHNLLAHGTQRGPNVAASGTSSGDHVQVINNVIYNNGGSVIQSAHHTSKVDYWGNYVKAGPQRGDDYYVFFTGEGDAEIYVKGNIGPTRSTDDLAEDLIVRKLNWDKIVGTPHGSPNVVIESAHSAYESVLSRGGAYQGINAKGEWFVRRDSLDDLIISQVQNGTGRTIDHPDEVGGYPPLDPGTPYSDVDQDGMPDDWELLHGLNPNDPSDAALDPDKDGYRNIEEYLNGTNPLGSGSDPAATSSACDLNGDNSTDVVDVQLGLNQALGVEACTTADLTLDGQCDIVDVQRLVNAALGMECRTGS